MNKTRKQIIELIEPYMDKTLSEGCYFYPLEENWFEHLPVKLLKIIDKWLYEDIRHQYIDIDWTVTDWSYKIKIIWHYDITAVLKYIDNYNFWSIRITENEIVTSLWDKNACIPNKPLILYTEQEEKELLELLWSTLITYII